MRPKHSRRIRFETLENRYMMAAIPGDYDVSGVVDATDYSVWKANFGNAGESVVDGNRNGVVDTADYTIWRDNFGKTLADVPPDPAQMVSAVVTGPTSIQITWQAVSGATSYNVQRRRPNVANDPYITVGANVMTTSFTDTMVASETVYEYQLIAQNTAGVSQPSQTTSVTAGQSNLTAYRPQQLHDLDGPDTPIYFPFAKTPVAEQDEAETDVGPGIRINRDDDNDNEIVDRFESGIPIVEENDLIEVRIDRLPGQGDLVLEAGLDLQLYYTYDKEQPVPLDDDGIFTDPLPFVNNVATVFVEWVTNGHGTDFVTLVNPTTMAVIDTLVFHTFTSLTVVLGGLNHMPSVPTDPNHGMFLTADQIYGQGYDVMKFDEDEVSDDITGGGEAGEGIPYDEIANAVNNRLVEDIVLLGYSQGAGSVYNLSQWLDQQNFLGEIGPYNLVFTAYVDGVRDDGPAAEDRLPTNTLWHLNLYQDAELTDPLLLDGTSVPGSNEDINVETSLTFNLPNITHYDIDQHPAIIDWVIMRYQENVER